MKTTHILGFGLVALATVGTIACGVDDPGATSAKPGAGDSSTGGASEGDGGSSSGDGGAVGGGTGGANAGNGGSVPGTDAGPGGAPSGGGGSTGGTAGGSGGANAGGAQAGGAGGGTGGAPGNGGTPSTGGADGGTAGSPGGGGSPTTCSPPCAAPTPVCDTTDFTCDVCATGAKDCLTGTDTPRTCVNGNWVNDPACGGQTPVCSNGVCAGLRVTGGLVSLGLPDPAGGGGYRLREQSLEVTPRTCGMVSGVQLCVTGGIQP